MDSHSLIRGVLAAAFIIAAALNAIGPSFVIDEFRRWGYVNWLRYLVACCEVVASILLCTTAYRFGAAIALVVLVGVLVSIGRDRSWLRMEYPTVLSILALGVLFTS